MTQACVAAQPLPQRHGPVHDTHNIATLATNRSRSEPQDTSRTSNALAPGPWPPEAQRQVEGRLHGVATPWHWARPALKGAERECSKALPAPGAATSRSDIIRFSPRASTVHHVCATSLRRATAHRPPPPPLRGSRAPPPTHQYLLSWMNIKITADCHNQHGQTTEKSPAPQNADPRNF